VCSFAQVLDVDLFADAVFGEDAVQIVAAHLVPFSRTGTGLVPGERITEN
jgi:hypothetical protein